MTLTMKMKMNTTVYGHTVGQLVKVECSSEGIPTDQMWRRRLKDRAVPCEIVVEKKVKSKKGVKDVE